MKATWAGPLLCCALLAGACAGDAGSAASSDEGAPDSGGTAVVAAPSDLDHANSLVSADRYTQELLRYALFLPLVHYDSALGFAPALARSWEMLGDTGVVMHLRDDVRWHDGVRTTAHDVVFTFQRARDTLTAFPNAEYFARWAAAEVVDSLTVRFRFEPHADPLAGLPFMPIMPRHLLDSIPPARLAQAAFNHAPVGNGPFRFVEYRPGDRWVFEANRDFPPALGGRPHLDRIVWRVIPDGTAQAIEARTGSADLILTPPAEQFDALDDDPALRGIVRAGRQYGFIGWNHRRAPLDDARVRRALTMAIDRRLIIDGLRGGHGQLAVGPIFPGHWAFNDALEPLPFAPDSARALLALAGIGDGDGDGVAERPDGRDFELELKYPSASDFNRDVAQLLQAHLAAVGVRLVLRPVEFQVLVADLTGAARDFDAALMGWESDFRVNLRDLFHGAALDGPLQFAGFRNTEVDRLLDEVARTVDRARAKPLWDRLQELLRDEQPWSFLYYFPDLYVASDRLRGVAMDDRGALVSVARWWIPADRQGPRAPARSDSAGRSPNPAAVPAR
jgi:peptide/nickel transport system substrate-binding protein